MSYTGKPGRVIVLNGPSSSGKSTFCKALQSLLLETRGESWWHVQMDAFAAMLPALPLPDWAKTDPADVGRFLSGWYGCIRALALAGNDVIAEAGFLEMDWLLEQIEALDGIEALYVGVFCPLEEVERREIKRGDRAIGYSRGQYDRVHLHGPYDVEVDTSILGPEEVAQVIKAALDTPPAPSAFRRIWGDREPALKPSGSASAGPACP